MYDFDELALKLAKTEADNVVLQKIIDRAIWWLNEIVENHRCTPISTAEKALAEIKQTIKTKDVNLWSGKN